VHPGFDLASAISSFQRLRRHPTGVRPGQIGIVDRRMGARSRMQMWVSSQQRFVHRVRIRHHQQRVPLGVGFRHRVGADDRAQRRPVLDHERVSEVFCKRSPTKRASMSPAHRRSKAR